MARILHPSGTIELSFQQTDELNDLPRMLCIANYASLIDPDEVLTALESDVQINSDIEVPTDRITVEKGRSDPMAMITRSGGARHAPWLGFISAKAGWWPLLADVYVKVHRQGNHYSHVSLYHSLEFLRKYHGIPWEMRTDTAFWPESNKITHYSDIKAHAFLLRKTA